MAKNQNLPTGKEINDNLNHEIVGMGKAEISAISREDAFKIMSAADESELQELTGEYFNFDKIGIYHFIFHGMTSFEKDGKTIECVKLETETGENVINGNTVLVNSLKKANTIPCYVRVNYVEDKKGNGGDYKSLRVHTFKA